MLVIVMIFAIIWPILGIPFLIYGLHKSVRTIRTGYAAVFGILYGTLGYNLFPIDETDLTRYYDMVDMMNGQSLLYVLRTDREHLYVKDILFYFVSGTGDHQILAFLVGFFVYTILMYMFFDTVNRYQLLTVHNGRFHVFFMGLLMLGIISPFNVIGNIRCVLAYVLICFAMYRQTVQKKSNVLTWLLYILPLGIHISAVFVLAIRIAIPVIKRLNKIFIFVAILLPVFISFVNDYIRYLNGNNWMLGMIRSAVSKAYYYVNWTEGGWADEVASSFSNQLNRIYGVFFIAIILLFYFLSEPDEKTESSRQEYIKIKDYIYAVSILALGCLSIKTGAFWRFESIVVFMAPMLLAEVLVNKVAMNKLLLPLLYLSGAAMFFANMIHFTRNIQMDLFVKGYLQFTSIKVIGEMLWGLYRMLL